MRYRTIPIERMKDTTAKFNLTVLYPPIPLKDTDIYVTVSYGTKWFSLASEYYGDPELWWIIAKANNDNGNIKLIPQTIRIPLDTQQIIDDYKQLNSI